MVLTSIKIVYGFRVGANWLKKYIGFVKKIDNEYDLINAYYANDGKELKEYPGLNFYIFHNKQEETYDAVIGKLIYDVAIDKITSNIKNVENQGYIVSKMYHFMEKYGLVKKAYANCTVYHLHRYCSGMCSKHE